MTASDPSPAPSSLHRRHWEADGEARGAVVLVHGLGEHSGRYDAVARYLAGAGYDVWAMDHWGHGRSPGKRGHVDRFDQFTRGVHECVLAAKGDEVGRPVAILGHSLGGLITASYLLDHPGEVRAAVLSGPALKIKTPIPAWKRALAAFLARRLPTLTLGNGLDPRLLSHDADVVRAYRDDPLVHDRVSAGLFAQMLDEMERVLDRAADLSLPLLVVAGAEDGIVDPAGAAELYNRAASRKKELHLFPNMYHEVLNEVGRHAVYTLVREWLDAHIDG